MIRSPHWGAAALQVVASLVLAATYVGCGSDSGPAPETPTDTGRIDDVATDTGGAAKDTGSVDSSAIDDTTGDTGASVDDADARDTLDGLICEGGESCAPQGAQCHDASGTLCTCNLGTWSC